MQPNQKTHGDKPPMQGNPLDELKKKVEGMYTATHEYTGVTIELVDKAQVKILIEETKEEYGQRK